MEGDLNPGEDADVASSDSVPDRNQGDNWSGPITVTGGNVFFGSAFNSGGGPMNYGVAAGESAPTPEDQLRFFNQSIYDSLKSSVRNSKVDKIDTAHEGTFDWLYDPSVGFADWLAGSKSESSPIFWISGNPGSGKSTLMKHALTDPRTHDILTAGSMQWKLVAFFFDYDGVAIQQSVEGLMEQFLNTMLQHGGNYFSVIRAVRLLELTDAAETSGVIRLCASGCEMPELLLSDEDVTQRLLQISSHFHGSKMHHSMKWSSEALEAAFIACASHPDIKSNICFFVDGLDEHTGEHRRLLQLLEQLAAVSRKQPSAIKLCLASRPEPIFSNALSKFPKLNVHERTAADIEHYVTDHLKQSASYLTNEDEIEEVDSVIREVTERAEGVFVWAKLVTFELCEIIEDGWAYDELKKTLESIPSKLHDLYRRIISTRKPSYRLERAVMLQICLVRMKILQRRDQVIWSLRAETLFAAVDYAIHAKISSMSHERMQSRLWSRCGGLLKMGLQGNGSAVEFCHRTASAFVDSVDYEEGEDINMTETSKNYGSVHMLRFLVFVLLNMDIQSHALHYHEIHYLLPYYDKARDEIGVEADAILQSILGSAYASEQLKKLISKSPRWESMDLRKWEDRRDIRAYKSSFFGQIEYESNNLKNLIERGYLLAVTNDQAEIVRGVELDGLHCYEACTREAFRLFHEWNLRYGLRLQNRQYDLSLYLAYVLGPGFVQRKLSEVDRLPVLLSDRPSIFAAVFSHSPEDLSRNIHVLRKIVPTLVNGKISVTKLDPNSDSLNQIIDIVKNIDVTSEELDTLCGMFHFLLENGARTTLILPEIFFRGPSQNSHYELRLLTSLLDYGADPNERLPNHSMLHEAIFYGWRAAAKVLLDYGADPNDAEEPAEMLGPPTLPDSITPQYPLRLAEMRDLLSQYKKNSSTSGRNNNPSHFEPALI